MTEKVRYPWSDWMDGNQHTLTAGIHFQVRIDVMQRMVRNEARRRGLENLRTRVVGNDIKIMFRPRRHHDYPWDDWLNGDRVDLIQGRDFDCSIDSFRRQLYRAATLRGQTIKKTKSGRDQGYMRFTFRANPKGGEV